MLKKNQIQTGNRTEMINIDQQVEALIRDSKVKSGTCVLWVPHTTAAVTINENGDPDVVRDILMEIDKIVPLHDDYHHYEGNSAAHIKSSLFGPSLTLVIDDGKLLLGRWQSIYFCEFDGPRLRSFLIKIQGD